MLQAHHVYSLPQPYDQAFLQGPQITYIEEYCEKPRFFSSLAPAPVDIIPQRLNKCVLSEQLSEWHKKKKVLFKLMGKAIEKP